MRSYAPGQSGPEANPVTPYSIEVESKFAPTVTRPSPPLRYWTWWLPLFGIGWLLVYATVFPEPWALVEENWPLFFVAFAGAVVGNATAIGGGIVFIPVMIFLYGINPLIALKLAITGQAFGMTSGAIGWLRRGTIPLDALKITVPGIVLGTVLSTWVLHPSSLLVKALLGPVSILIGLGLLINNKTSRTDIPPQARWPLFGIALLGGLITGWVAIGVGELVAAFLMLAYGVRAERVIGLGVLLLAINSVLLAILHQFTLDGLPWTMGIFMALGCFYGARLGPYLTQWIDQHQLKRWFAVIAIGSGILFLLSYLWFM